MKKSLFRAALAIALSVPALSANAALMNYNEQFDYNAVHYSLNFIADDTNFSTLITSLTGFAGTNPITLAAPNTFYSNDNLFYPTEIIGGGWSASGGLGFHDTVSGLDFALYVTPYLWLTSSDFSMDGYVM